MADEANDQGWKRLADGAWGQGVQGLGQHPQGHLGLGRCKRMSTGRTDRCCRSRREAHAWVETVGAGAESQAASQVCSGGVSAVMGSSDLDEHSFGADGHKGNRC